jgi:LacI family transcriptional regulator
MADKKRAEKSSGERAAGKKKAATLKDVAEHVGLSPSTVSLVLNRAPAAQSIPAETHERVLAAAHELDYRPNFVARSLRSRRTFSIGVLVPEISEGYATAVMSGVEDHLLDNGFFSLMASHRFRDDLIAENLVLLRDRLVEGFILVNTRLREAPGLPTVTISSHERFRDVINVVIDHDRAAMLALNHLAELGHRRIAVLRGHPLTGDASDRWRAISEAADSLGLDIPPELTLQFGDDASEEGFSPDAHLQEGYEYGEKLLATGAEFTAFFAFNDIAAIGAMKAFADSSLRVPEDISVVGFDDIESAAFHNPSLSTVRQPMHEMGEIAARLLLERLGGETPESEVVTVEPSLVVRESTGPAPARAANRLGTKDGNVVSTVRQGRVSRR